MTHGPYRPWTCKSIKDTKVGPYIRVMRCITGFVTVGEVGKKRGLDFTPDLSVKPELSGGVAGGTTPDDRILSSV